MKLADLYACEMCRTVKIQPVSEKFKHEQHGAFCYVCKAQRRFIPVSVKISPRGQVVIEIP